MEAVFTFQLWKVLPQSWNDTKDRVWKILLSNTIRYYRTKDSTLKCEEESDIEKNIISEIKKNIIYSINLHILQSSLGGGGLGPKPLSGAEELDGLGRGGGDRGADGVVGFPAKVRREPPEVLFVLSEWRSSERTVQW